MRALEDFYFTNIPTPTPLSLSTDYGVFQRFYGYGAEAPYEIDTGACEEGDLIDDEEGITYKQFWMVMSCYTVLIVWVGGVFF